MSHNWFANGSPQRNLFDSLSERRFLLLDQLRSLEVKQITVAFKTQPSFKSIDLSLKPLVALPFGESHAIHCGALVVGYLFLMPKLRQSHVSPLMATFRRKDDIADIVNTYFTCNELACIGNSDALAVVAQETYWTKSKDTP